MNGDRRLYVRGYHAGLSNNRMSLDIAIALAWLTDRTLVPFDFDLPEVRHRGRTAPSLFDLFDLPVPWVPHRLTARKIKGSSVRRCDWKPVFDSVFAWPVPDESELRFRDFRNGRAHVNTFESADDDAPDLVIDTRTLGYYSYFFYLEPDRQRALIELMGRLLPKRPYRELAARIVADLGPFQAIHVRRNDFVTIGFTPRVRTVTGDEIADVLEPAFDHDQPLVICTDQPDDTEFFAPIRKRFPSSVLLDELLDSDRHRADVAALPYGDPSEIGLLTQLVAAQADRFAGTLFSTFTGIIHRLRGLSGRDDEFRFCYDDFGSALAPFSDGVFAETGTGAFSWNRLHLPVLPGQLSWVREWPESFTVVDEPARAPGTVELAADRAVIVGDTAQLQGEAEPNIGYWTDPTDAVQWAVDPFTAERYDVELRYSVPPSIAGSRFEIDVGDTPALAGSLPSTGAWEIPSPWVRVGTVPIGLDPSPVRVAITALAGEAAMNLYDVRLVPADRRRGRPTLEELAALGASMNSQPARRRMVERLGRAFAFTAAIETGTSRGDTTPFLADALGCEVWSVESDPARHEFAAARFPERGDLHFHLGDSRALIADLAPELGERRTFFYLDAHWNDDLPLWDEVALAFERWRDPIVLIDDFAVPGDYDYGFDRYRTGDVLDLEDLLPHLPAGVSCWFPTTPSGREGGFKRGCVVLARDEHADRLRTCLLRRHEPRPVAVGPVDPTDERADGWVREYRRLNATFDTICVYRMGVGNGLFSEINNLVLAVLYCLHHGIQFRLSSAGSNLAAKDGWADYFLPFCEEDRALYHWTLNGRGDPTMAEPHRRAAGPAKIEHGVDLLTQDIWEQFRGVEFRGTRFEIPTLGIAGDLLQAASVVVGHLWRFQPAVRARVDELVQQADLPDDYVGFHIRRGDKAFEFPTIELDHYFTAAEQHTELRTAFLATDDFGVVTETRERYASWAITTLCREDARGHVQRAFNALGPTDRFRGIVELLADVEALHGAQQCFVTFSSNIGAFLGMRRGPAGISRIHSVDLPHWVIL